MTSVQKACFISLFCEAILHGMYTILTGGALYLLLRKRRSRRMAITNLVMITLTVLMYCMSTAHIALALRADLIAFFEQHAIEGGPNILNDQGDALVWVQNMLELINCIIGDSIVCWRTWVLWGRDLRVVIFPALCITTAIVSSSGMILAFSKSPPGGAPFAGSIVIWFAFFGVSSCVANIYSVVMIAWKAWANARYMKAMNVNIVGGKYYGAVLLIAESGTLYCVALIITFVLFLLNSNGVYVMSDILNHLTGIYPTIIIVMVCLKITFHDDMTRAETLSNMRGDSNGGSPGSGRARRTASNGMLSWRVAENSKLGTNTFGTETSGSSYRQDPSKVGTSTEQVLWFNPNGSGDLRACKSFISDNIATVAIDDEATKKVHGIAEAV